MSILAEIFVHKEMEVAQTQRRLSLARVEAAAEQAAPALDFVAALRQAGTANGSPALIAEIKRASPSRGLLAPRLDAAGMAHIYAHNGAAAISVLTDKTYFQGSLEDLRSVSTANLGLPILRKDFICDAYQIYEARMVGADAILLIVAGLESGKLTDLHALICSLGMTPLVEVHNQAELELALDLQPVCVGVNNRDLRDFSVNLETSLHLRASIPAEICVVAESGIHTRQDVQRLAQAGVDAILVGEALVTAPDTAAQVRSLAWLK